MLRRLKEHVCKQLSRKLEIIVYAAMSSYQQEYSQLILSNTLVPMLQKKYGTRQYRKQSSSFQNKCIQLQKCCNHPYLLDEPEEDDDFYEHLISACGKLQLLDKMLHSLNQNGHRVLIFSQMTKMLDLLQDYLEHQQYSYN